MATGSASGRWSCPGSTPRSDMATGSASALWSCPGSSAEDDVHRQHLGLLELSGIDAEVRHGRRQRDNMPEV